MKEIIIMEHWSDFFKSNIEKDFACSRVYSMDFRLWNDGTKNKTKLTLFVFCAWFKDVKF